MTTQIDFNVLEGIAKAVLDAHVPESRRFQLERVTDQEPQSSDVAWVLTAPDKVIDSNHKLGDGNAHMLGFQVGLRLGALIASNPSLRVPDLSDLIAEYHTETARLASFGPRDYVKAVCEATERDLVTARS